MWLKFARKFSVSMILYTVYLLKQFHLLILLRFYILVSTYNVVIWGGSCIAGTLKITISVNKLIRTILEVKFINYLPTLHTSKWL